MRRSLPRYDEPFHWWGTTWESGPQFAIAHLLRDGTLDVANGAILWQALAMRRSVVVISGPSRLGKTTLLSALLPLMPSDTRRIHVRGSFETFAFLQDPAFAPEKCALLINEISPHLPMYLWGPAVSRALVAAERGYALLATAHGTSVPEFVGSLTGSPLRIQASRVAALEVVVLLQASTGTASGRQVSGVWKLTPERDGLAMTALSRVPSNISHELDAPPTPSLTIPWLSPPEIAMRRDLLTALRDGEIADLPDDLGSAAVEREVSGESQAK